MKNSQKRTRAAAWIGASLLLLLTVFGSLGVSANGSLSQEPVRSMLHLRLELEDMDTLYTQIQEPPEPDMTDIDPEHPDYWIYYDERLAAMNNAVIVGTTSTGSKYIYQSDYWKISSTPYENEPSSSLTLCTEEEGNIIYSLYFTDNPDNCYIYSNYTGENYTQIDIYLEPQFTYTTAPSFLNLNQRDADMIKYLTKCGFQVSIAPYPDTSLVYNDGYTHGHLEGYDEGYTAAGDQAQQSYDQGYSDGYGDGQTEALNGTGTLKEMIFAIFSAPSELINGFLDFDLFGINVASLVKTLLTISITALIVYGILKLTKG